MFTRKNVWSVIALLVVVAITLSACGGAAQPTAAPPAEATKPPETGGFQIPDVVAGKFNVAMVLIGPHDDGGWSQAHYEGLEYIAKNVDNVHIAYIENVPEGRRMRPNHTWRRSTSYPSRRPIANTCLK